MDGKCFRNEPAQAVFLPHALLLCALLSLLTGCQSWYYPQIDPSGNRIFLPPESAVVQGTPVLPGLPIPQERITMHPREIVAPVGSEVVMTASVCGPDGQMVQGERIEWMLAPNSQGQFIALGKNGGLNRLRPENCGPHKVDNAYAIGTTSTADVRISRGTKNPQDDVLIQRGQAWVTVTSPTEGTSVVTAYAPVVRGWDQRKTTGVIHWVDAQWLFPPAAVKQVGERHTFTTLLTRQSNEQPLSGWIVRYEILGGSLAGFAPDGGSVVEVPTDASGQASVEVYPLEPRGGNAAIAMQVIRPARPNENASRPLVLGSGTTSIQWTAPDLAVQITGPGTATRDAALTYQIQVSNPGVLATSGVVVTSDLPPGVRYLSSTPAAVAAGQNLQWEIGGLAPGQSTVVELNVRAEQTGAIEQCVSATSAGGLSSQSCTTTNVSDAAPQPNLAVRIEGPQETTVGENVRFDIFVTNNGTADAKGVVMRDQFDAGFKHQVVAQNEIEYRKFGDIAAGETKQAYLIFEVVQAGKLCHRINISSDTGQTGAAESCLTAREASPAAGGPADNPAIQVIKSGVKQGRVGETAEFTITIANTGNSPLTNIRVADSYELALEPFRATGNFQVDGETVVQEVDEEELIWTLRKLNPGRKIQLNVLCKCLSATPRGCGRVLVTCDQKGPVQDEACIEILAAPEPPDTTPPTTDPTPTIPPDLEVTITSLNEPVTAGSTLTYRLFVKNLTRSSANDVQLSLTLPPQMSPTRGGAGIRAPAMHKVTGQSITFEPIAEQRTGETLTFTIPVQTRQAGKVLVRATVRAAGLTEPVQKEVTTNILAPR